MVVVLTLDCCVGYMTIRLLISIINYKFLERVSILKLRELGKWFVLLYCFEFSIALPMYVFS